MQISSSRCKLGVRYRSRFEKRPFAVPSSHSCSVGKLEHFDFDSRSAINVSRSCRVDRSARLRKLNDNPQSRHRRPVGLLSLHSRPLTGNSVRRAGSNSPPRSDPRPELRRGPGPDSVHSFFGRFERSSPGGGGTRTVHFSGRAGIFAA